MFPDTKLRAILLYNDRAQNKSAMQRDSDDDTSCSHVKI